MSTPTRAFKGVWIPVEIWDSAELSWMEKCLLAEINSLDHGDGCYAGNEFLAERFKTTAGNIAKIICELRSKKFIEDIAFDGRTRWIKVTIPITKQTNQTLRFGKGRDSLYVNADEGCTIDGENKRGCETGLITPSVDGSGGIQPPIPKPVVRERNKLLDALVAVDGSDPLKSTSPAFAGAAKALMTIKEVSPDVTPEEIKRRAKNYKVNYKDWSLTPLSLAKYWGGCDRLNIVKPKGPNI